MPRQKLKKRPDGRYACRYKDMFFYGDTSAEALAKRDAYKLELSQGLVHDAAGLTVEEYADMWLPIHRAGCCQKSYDMYAKILGSFCAQNSGRRMRDITKSNITAYYNTLRGYSASHIAKHTVTIRAMFQSAQDDGVILRNPCAGVDAPHGEQGTHRVLEKWEQDAVCQLIDHRFGVCAMLMLYAGLRRGEALAVDLGSIKDGHLRVDTAVSYSYGAVTTKTPKTYSGTRTVPLFGPLKQLEGRAGKAFVPVSAQDATETAFRRAWGSWKHAFEQLTGRPCTIRTHDFRHTYCTMLCEAGVDIKTAMTWMGHSDETMIRRIYDHMTDTREKSAEALVDAVLSAQQKKPEKSGKVVNSVVKPKKASSKALKNNGRSDSEP